MFFSKVLLAISLGSISALATPHDLALQHRDDAAAGTPNSPDPVQPQLGNANGMNYAYVTAFAPGHGACGFDNTAADNAVAWPEELKPVDIGLCGTKIKILYKGKETEGTIVDSCPSCKANNGTVVDFQVSPNILTTLGVATNNDMYATYYILNSLAHS